MSCSVEIKQGRAKEPFLYGVPNNNALGVQVVLTGFLSCGSISVGGMAVDEESQNLMVHAQSSSFSV